VLRYMRDHGAQEAFLFTGLDAEAHDIEGFHVTSLTLYHHSF
jgi:hypothetical protein